MGRPKRGCFRWSILYLSGNLPVAALMARFTREANVFSQNRAGNCWWLLPVPSLLQRSERQGWHSPWQLLRPF